MADKLGEFPEIRIPGRKSEDYRYSPLEKILHGGLELAQDVVPKTCDLDPFRVPGFDGYIVVVRNGVFDTQASELKDLQKGVTILSLKSAIKNNDKTLKAHFDQMASMQPEPLAVLNTRMAPDGVFVHIGDGVTLAKPVHIVSLYSTGSDILYHSRNLVVLGKNATAEIFETFHGTEKGGAFTLSSLTEIKVGESSSLRYYQLQDSKTSCHHLSHIYASVNEKAHFDTNTTTLSGKWIRNNLRIFMDGDSPEVHLNGLVIATGEMHVDNNTLADHRFPNGQSHQLYKGVLGGRSTGVFNGKIFVQQDAQKTNAYQSSKNILLSDDASINAKPQLEIYADDVKCSHGSSTGKLDEEALFYFRSRGIGEEAAKKLLLGAFCADVLDTVRNPVVKEFIQSRVTQSLQDV